MMQNAFRALALIESGSMPKKIVRRRSPIHGNGVFAAVDLPADIDLIEYRGRRLTHRQADRLYGDTAEDGHTFLFILNDRYVIDANVDGNDARWINTSCKPNCQAVVEESPGRDRREDRVMIRTLRPIKAGEELSYDYGISIDGRITERLKRIWACHCGQRGCIGTMLKPKRKRAG